MRRNRQHSPVTSTQVTLPIHNSASKDMISASVLLSEKFLFASCTSISWLLTPLTKKCRIDHLMLTELANPERVLTCNCQLDRQRDNAVYAEQSSCQSLIACSVPPCDRSCECVDCQRNVKSTSSGEEPTFKYTLRND